MQNAIECNPKQYLNNKNIALTSRNGSLVKVVTCFINVGGILDPGYSFSCIITPCSSLLSRLLFRQHSGQR